MLFVHVIIVQRRGSNRFSSSLRSISSNLRRWHPVHPNPFSRCSDVFFIHASAVRGPSDEQNRPGHERLNFVHKRRRVKMAPTSYRADPRPVFQLVQIVRFSRMSLSRLESGGSLTSASPSDLPRTATLLTRSPSAVDTLLDQAILPHRQLRSSNPIVLILLLNKLND